jgi:PPOX class probable F420-dependent enzyme
MGFRLSTEEAWAFLAQAHTSIVTTLRKDGRPIAVPVWHVVSDQTLYVQTPTATKKLARIRNDDRAHVLVEAGRAWGELRAVSFEARATIVEDGQPILDAINEKYAAFLAPADGLPAPVRERYSQMTVVRLDPVGRLNSFNNAALISASASS